MLTHFVIFKFLVSIFSLSLVWQTIVGIILAILCISFVFISILAFYFNNSFTRTFYVASAVWLGFIFYLLLASGLYFLLLGISSIFNINVSLKWFGVLCLILAIVVGIYGVIHARTILVKKVEVSLPNLPIAWQGKKTVWISDLHLGEIYGRDFSENVVNKINEINPDIIFIGGDLYDGVKVDESDVIKPFADLHPALGIYFITGNHEEFRDNKHYLDAIKNIGIRVLNNEMVNIQGLQLIGLDDRDSKNVAKLENIFSNLNLNKNEPSILLKHQPSQLDVAAKAGISFQISGHTHRAQMFPLNIFSSLIFKGYDYGLKMWDKMAVYTSSGVGSWGPPLRVGSDSEIVVFEFTSIKK
jgi:hypothetical protein